MSGRDPVWWYSRPLGRLKASHSAAGKILLCGLSHGIYNIVRTSDHGQLFLALDFGVSPVGNCIASVLDSFLAGNCSAIFHGSLLVVSCSCSANCSRIEVCPGRSVSLGEGS